MWILNKFWNPQFEIAAALVVTFIISITSLYPQTAKADFDFSTLSSDDVDNVNKDFSAWMAHTTVAPAVGLLQEGGWEFGLIVGTVSTPNVKDIVAEEHPEDAQYRVYNAGLIAAYAYTRKLTFELKIVPDLTVGETTIGSQSLAGKLSFGDKDGRWDGALRLFITNSYVRSKSIINNDSTGNQDVQGEVKFTSLSTGLTYLYGVRTVELNSVFIMPYVGAGVIFANSDLQVKSKTSSSIFADGSTEQSSSETGAMFLLGMETNYMFTKFGFEYARVFDSDKVTFKIAFGY